MTSLAWETQLKTSEHLQQPGGGLVTWEMFCEMFVVSAMFWFGFAHQISLVVPLEDFLNSRKIVGDINDYALVL